MSFDDDVDELKKELQTDKLSPEQRKLATDKLCGKLQQVVNSRRLGFTVSLENNEPVIHIKHNDTKEHLATVSVDDEGGVTFQSPLFSGEADEDEDADVGYFPSYAEFYDEEEFLDEAPEILKQGVAEYELDKEAEPKA